jgi:hypothetical protein
MATDLSDNLAVGAAGTSLDRRDSVIRRLRLKKGPVHDDGPPDRLPRSRRQFISGYEKPTIEPEEFAINGTRAVTHRC